MRTNLVSVMEKSEVCDFLSKMFRFILSNLHVRTLRHAQPQKYHFKFCFDIVIFIQHLSYHNYEDKFLGLQNF
ncbi:hypothetical protein LguiA_003109 [Lonicera macranthoides]